MMGKLKVCILQTDIVWQDVDANIMYINNLISKVKSDVDIVVLPEMCTSGFSMSEKDYIADKAEYTIDFFTMHAREKCINIFCSIIVRYKGGFRNRLYMFVSDGSICFYDKHHLFSMAKENENFTPGNILPVFSVKGFNICPLICYDLRFPVWSRNVNNAYDIIICVANWPKSRINAWDILLKARAIENQAYIIGVNRIGIDGLGIEYNGSSMCINAKGVTIANAEDRELTYAELCLNELKSFRRKFPSYRDADDFSIIS